ncbi:MAG: hypothetical protein AMXMBFR36_29130 [Acidobacteriota bacterium]
MRDHLWIALWAVCMTLAALVGVFAFDDGGVESPAERAASALASWIWIAVETCVLLIAAALLRELAPWVRLLGYFTLLGALTSLFGYGLYGFIDAPREVRWHFVSLALSAACVLSLSILNFVRRAKPMRKAST